MFLEPCLEQGGIVEKQSRSKPKAVVFNSAVFMTADTAVVFEAFDLAQIDSRFLLSKNIFKKKRCTKLHKKLFNIQKPNIPLIIISGISASPTIQKQQKKILKIKIKLFALILKLGLVKTKQKQKEY